MNEPPLAGRRVVVTRAREQASGLAAELRALGAEVVEVPTIAIADPADGGAGLRWAAAETGRYDWVVLTSVNAVERLLDVAPSLGRAKVAAVGPATADALRAGGVPVDLVPERAVAESLLETFPPGPGRVLLPQADRARPVLADGLRAAGWEVDAVEAYRTVPATPSPAAVAAATGADAITFTSSSTVTGYLDTAGPAAVPPVVACIGPVTAATAREAGLTVTVEAAEHTVAGLVDALLGVFADRPPVPRSTP